MNTAENNRIIAEFMGILYGMRKDGHIAEDSKVRIHSYLGIEGTEGLHIDYLKFHQSWDWLMPVVEKIESILPDDSIIYIQYKDCIIPVIEGEFEIQCSEDSKIGAVYRAVCEFIVWYNEKSRD